MYDFLNKIGLKAVLEAIKGKMPTSLPANGGNADTVGRKVPEKIFYDNGFSDDLDGATQSGCYATSPDTLNVPFPAWWLVDTTNYNNQFIVQKAHTIGNTAHTVSYIRNYANNAWSDWEEISTTPIKSELISASTDLWSHIKLFSISENKKPFAVSFANYSRIYSIFNYDGYYYLDLYDGGTLQPIPNTPLDFRVYYYY